MSGQMKIYREKQKLVDEFVSLVDPYKKIEPLKFDMREYGKYLEEQNLSGEYVPEEILKQFRIID